MDRRSARTQDRLQRALLELATERAMDEITIGDIAERAEVNRSSFYQHYADKETLLAEALDAIVDEVGANVPTPFDHPSEPPEALVDFLRQIEERADLYRWAVGPRGSAVVMDRVRVRVEAVVLRHLALAGDAAPYAGIPVDLVAAAVAGSGLGAIRWWLESEPRPPVTTAAAWIWRLLVGIDPHAGASR